MPSISKKFLLLLTIPVASVITDSTEQSNGTAHSRTGMTVAVNTLVTAAAIAAVMPVGGFLNDPANIESVGYATTNGVNAIIVIRTVANPNLNTESSVSMSAGLAKYTASVTHMAAFTDQGLTQDAEIAAMNSLASSLASALA